MRGGIILKVIPKRPAHLAELRAPLAASLMKVARPTAQGAAALANSGVASGLCNSTRWISPAKTAPTIGATQKSHSCESAHPPTNKAGPVDRAGLTDVLVTGILTK